jgi:heme exporter protein CcmD
MDLSSFYHHTLSYETYVLLAYGVAGAILALLMMFVFLKHRKLSHQLEQLSQ